MVTKVDCLRPENLKREPAKWNGQDVFVRMLRGDEASLLRKVQKELGNDTDNPDENLSALGFCIMCVCDEEGNRLFDTSDKDALLAGPLFPIIQCGQIAIRLNGFSEDAQAALEKNS